MQIHEQIAEWITQAESCVAFTGAGISTESGIPDFRSPGGIWSKYEPVYFDDFMANAQARHEYWRQKAEGHADFAKAQPNAGHSVLAQWESSGRLCGVITQNIDGLHAEAGSSNVAELHGNARKIKCLDCAALFETDPLVAEFLETDRVPPCEKCGGRLKHATVSFGQSLPEEVLRLAVDWSRKADLMIAMGSSLQVQPAAGLPMITKDNGGRLVIINRDETGLDNIADATVHGSIGETLTAIDSVL